MQGRIKLEYNYARLNEEINVLELDREKNAVIASAGVSSSSSDNPDWKKMSDRIEQISVHRAQMVTELRRAIEVFKKLQDVTKPKVGIQIRDTLKKEETVSHKTVYSSKE